MLFSQSSTAPRQSTSNTDMASPLQVVLNVYDLHESNRMLYNLGVGFFHTGVEINGYEFSFSNAGVVRTRPQLPEFGSFRERIAIGIYEGGMSGVYAAISTLRNSTFQPGAYHPTNLNCNHFSDAFCMALVGRHIPAWINRAAGIGSTMGAIPQAPNTVAREETFAAPGKVRSPEAPVPVNGKAPAPTTSPIAQSTEQPATTTTSSIFSWFGWGGTQTSGSGIRATAPVSKPASAPAPAPAARKELTEKQKELLAKMKK